MRKTPVWLLIVCLTCPALAADTPASPRRVSVEQLERLLSSPKAKSDSEMARQLAALELTERLSTSRFDQLKVQLPGEKSQQALLALADLSAFLAPPRTEIPATAPPDMASQKGMMARTVGYLAKTLPLLPNLFASRDTTRFENHPSDSEITNGENPLHAVNRSVMTVFFRDHQEFVDVGSRNDKSRTPDKGLTTWGEFGPIMGTIMIDAAQNQLAWSHWELGGAGPLAVFRYTVPKAKSHYNVRFCCTTESYGLEVNFLTQHVGYHGEIALDPDSGAILRLTLIGDPDAQDPIRQASLIVEYGPEEIGGKTYLCPVHGIALATAPDLKALNSSLVALAQLQEARSKGEAVSLQKSSLATLAQQPKQVLLNDVSFRQYHLFRTEARVWTGKAAEDSAASAAFAPPPSTPDTSSSGVIPAEEAARMTAPNPTVPQPVAGGLVLESAVTPAPPVIPEIYVAPSNGLPDSPALQPVSGSDAGSAYRITARLVDVSLVALDKKGHPLTNVNPDNLEVYDDGVKVDLRSFSQAGTAAPAPALAATQTPGAETKPGFSNRNAATTKPAPGDLQNTIVLLLDNNLSFDDLQNARQQMEQFIRGLHQNERASLYVMRRTGFQVLQDTTADHELLAQKLAKWTPISDNIALGQEQEARNRQQIEYVHNTEDMLSVNGHGLTDNQAQTQALDPQLRELGDNPGRDALSKLVVLARHLAGVQGHKSLVWIASDNVLADWTQANLNIDKGSRYVEPTALRAQEAMNEAHVSVYPLDASRLEAGGLDASVASPNVMLNPAATANQMPAQFGGGCGNISAGLGGTASQASDPALDSGADVNTCNRNLDPGRLKSQMQQDLHSIQGVYREIADATGGRPFRRASDIVAELNGVAADGRATYLLSFAPPQAADDKYHKITVKLNGSKNVTLRYRTGYYYRHEATTIKDRFREAVSQPEEMTEIGLKADLAADVKERRVKLQISAADLEIAQKDSSWTDKVDVYVVQRELSGTKARVSGQSMDLHLQPGSYQKYLKDGIPFDQLLEVAPDTGSLRIIVLDENSGRMGSVTIPVSALANQS